MSSNNATNVSINIRKSFKYPEYYNYIKGGYYLKRIIGIFIMMLLIISTSSTANLSIRIDEKEQLMLIKSINEDIIDMIEQIDENIYLGYLESIVNFGPRKTGTNECEQTATYIYTELENMGLDVRYHDWSHEDYQGKNIEATLHGSDENSNEIYILSCHYDTTANSPGANDAGSGVAAMLVAANILSQYNFNHTIRFVAFSGECQGAYGSHEYVKEVKANEDNIIGVLHGDNMGWADNDIELDNIFISENTESQGITNFMIEVNQLYDIYINLKIHRNGAWYHSDHISFWELGYSAIWFAQVTLGGYWGPIDTIENLNIEYCLRGSKLLLATLASLADSNMGLIPNKPIVNGPEEGKVGEEFIFSTSSIDPYNKELNYLWDWGDGTQSEWLGSYSSGEIVSASYTWDEEGIYQVKVKVKNSDELESDWSNPFLVGIPKKNDGVDQQQTKHGNMGYGAFGGSQLAQSFTPSQNTISKISLYLFRQGDPPGLTVSIRDNLNNGDLTSAYILGSDLRDELKGVWFEFDLPEIDVTPGQTYYIIWTGDKNEAGNSIYWLFGDDNPYPNGMTWFNQGYIWEEYEIPDSNNGDFCFKTFYAKSKSKSINVNLLEERFMDWIFERLSLLELLVQKKYTQPKVFSLDQLPSFVYNSGKLFNKFDSFI
jgi:hypothetical protein